MTKKINNYIFSLLAAESSFEKIGESTYLKIPGFFDSGGSGPAYTKTAGDLVLQVITLLLLLVGSLAVVFLIVGGYRYVMAAGNEEAAESAKKTITHAILGLVIVILSFAIIAIISRILIGGQSGVFGP